jgi:hypothetical protein
MEIYHLSTHNGQWSYVHSGVFERELPKYECLYCGSGDYILSAKPSPMKNLYESKPITYSSDIDFPTNVPEPKGFYLIALLLLVLFVLWKKK